MITFDPILLAIFQGFWFIIPAYAANGFPPMAKGKHPIDFGKTWRGKRILGDGKTIEGTIAAIIGGLLFGFILILFQSNAQINSGIPINQDIGLVTMTWSLIILITLGAIAGDFIGSFIKRRLNIPRGASLPFLDQLGFVIFALIFAAPLYIPQFGSIVFIIVVTPLIHLFGNFIAYKSKLKKVWW